LLEIIARPPGTRLKSVTLLSMRFSRESGKPVMKAEDGSQPF